MPQNLRGTAEIVRRSGDSAGLRASGGIEFDGESKYVIDGDPARAHWLEKQRHDRIVEAGHLVIHVTWAQLWDEPALRFRVNRARRRALQLPA